MALATLVACLTLWSVEGRLRYGALKQITHTPEELWGPSFRDTPWPAPTEFALGFIRYPLDLLAVLLPVTAAAWLFRRSTASAAATTIAFAVVLLADLFWWWATRLAFG